MRFPNFEFFDGTRKYIEAKNYTITNPYDGSKLYNVKPASLVIPFTSSSDAPQIVWDSQYAVTFTHTLNCYPIVHVYNNNGNETYPDLKINSGTSFTLTFSSDSKPGNNQTYICTVTFGAEYGTDGNINSDVATVLRTIQDLVDYITGGGYNVIPPSPSDSSSSSSSPYIEISEKGVANGVAELDSNGIVPRSQSPLNGVTVLSLFDYEDVNLYDASMSGNNYKNTYVHRTMYTPSYVLPDVTDESIVHEIVIEVMFASFSRDTSRDIENIYYAWSMYSEEMDDYITYYTDTETPVDGESFIYFDNNGVINLSDMLVTMQNSDSTRICLASSVLFVDESNNMIVPLSTPEIVFGTVVNYLCRWSNIAHRWCIMPIMICNASNLEEESSSSSSQGVN